MGTSLVADEPESQDTPYDEAIRDETAILDDASSRSPSSSDPYVVQRRAPFHSLFAIDEPGQTHRFSLP